MIAAVAAGLAFVVAGILYAWQPRSRIASLDFRPTFAGASEGQYPNGLPFAASDITAASVLDSVYDANGIDQNCPRDVFKRGFFVEQQSAEYSFLEAEFQGRLADLRLTSVDRERLQAEYEAKRASIPLQFRLVFVAHDGCRAIPKTITAKALGEVLSVWAEQSESRRGVLKLQVAVLGPGVLDIGSANGGSSLVRADVIRSALRRIIANVREVEGLPGAGLVRVGDQRITLAEIRAKLEGLIQGRLEPLVVTAGRGLGAESRTWVREALATAVQEQSASENRVQAFREALRVYSGTPVAGPSPSPRSQEVAQGDVRTQIDGSFIDRMLEMAEPNVVFRQELTSKMVDADMAAAESRARVAYYQHLGNALQGAGGSLTEAAVEQALNEIVADGKGLVGQFNLLYDEWSMVSFRPSAGMFRISASVRDETTHTGRLLTIPLAAVAVFLIGLVGGLLIFLARDHYADRRLRRRPTAEP